jgi:protein O-GlcNAc transferase
VASARVLCEDVLRRAPRNPEAACLLAMCHLIDGRAADAIPLFEQTLSADARNGMALEHLGLAHLMTGQNAAAERVLQRAFALPGAPPSVAMRLGLALMNQGRYDSAIAHLQQALAREPENADARLNLGRALAQTGDIQAARLEFETALKLDAGNSDAAFNLGVLDLQTERLESARTWFERALETAADASDARVNLGVVFHRQGRLGQARASFDAALREAPALPAALEGVAMVTLAQGRPREAIEHLKRALQTEPHRRSALSTLAETLFDVGELDEATKIAERVRNIYPDDPTAYSTLANVHIVRGQVEAAIQVLEAGHEATKSSGLLGMLTYQLRQACEWDKWQTAWPKLAAELETSAALGSPFWLLCEPTSAAQQRRYTERWAEARFRSVAAPRPTRHPGQRHPRIRLGYLSSDLQEHAAAYLIAEVLELHDRERFEVFAYSHGPDDGGAMRRRLVAACEHFLDISREPDDVAAERIRRDEIDILVDLKGYTVGDRLTIMARRPCNVQVTWLGYPGTTGAAFMDYLIADPFIIPPGAESGYTERVVRMPHCYQPNDRKRPVGQPLSRSEYGLPDDAFVFCCFNQTYKITPEVFGVWMRLLQYVPESVLWLLEGNAIAKRKLIEHAETAGLAAERLVFASRVPYSAHLARFRVADLALDTFPYTSHTILSDALWCGCPTVALCGETFASRVSGSLLTAAGLPDLVTYQLGEYELRAQHLAHDTSVLNEVKSRVGRARNESRLFDSAAFTRNLEELYSGLLPDST